MDAAAMVFWATMVVTGSLDLSLLVTLVAPSLQVWPLPGRRMWK